MNRSVAPRIRLRVTLLVSSVTLLLLAVMLFAVGGFVWTIAPLTLAVLTLLISMGNSPALFLADIQQALGINPPPQPLPSTQTQPPPPSLTRPAANEITAPPLQYERPFGIALLTVALTLSVASLYLFPKEQPNTSAWICFGLSVSLALASMPAFEGGWSKFIFMVRTRATVAFEFTALLPWLGLTGITFIALGIRLYNLDTYPTGMWFDEADILDKARVVAQNPSLLPVFIPFTEVPSLFLLPVSIVIKVTGISITTGRFVAALFGVAGVVTTFLMARHMMGAATGLVAALLTAVMRWDITWSRLGMHGITAPFFAALTAWLTYRAVQHGQTSSFALAGSVLGLGTWYYAAYRLFPLVIGFILIHSLISSTGKRQRLAKNIGVMALFAILTTLPLLQYIIFNQDEFFKRAAVTSVFSLAPEGETIRIIAKSTLSHLGMFHITGDTNGRHNIPGAPMLDILSGALMLVGLLVALKNWRQAAFAALPVWLAVMLLPGILTVPWEAPQSLRTITVIPAVATLAAIGVTFLLGMVKRSGLPGHGVAAILLLSVTLSVITYSNVSAYFDSQANNPEVYAAHSTSETLMARDMTRQSTRGYSPMVSRQFQHSLVATLFDHRFPRQTIAAPLTIPLNPEHIWMGAAIYLEPREPGFFDTLKTYYPDAEFHEVRPPSGGQVLYYAAYINKEQLEAVQGLVETRYFEGGATSEHILRSTVSPPNTKPTKEVSPIAIQWKGSLHITQPGSYLFTLKGDKSASALLDDVVILNDERRTMAIEPAVGLHLLEVRSLTDTESDAISLLWQPPNSTTAAPEPIPMDHLYHGSVRPVGLTGRFFRGPAPPALVDSIRADAMRVTPGLGGAFWYTPVIDTGSHLAVWDGTLTAPEEDTYRLELYDPHGSMRVEIDGLTVLNSGNKRRSEIPLTAGAHRIRLEYLTNAVSPKFGLLWGRPGQPMERIQPEYLSPATEHMFR